jgi:hypothetical protein
MPVVPVPKDVSGQGMPNFNCGASVLAQDHMFVTVITMLRNTEHLVQTSI